ncbi:MAG: DUF1176 domain-containing protein [Sphingopyxis sp.]
MGTAISADADSRARVRPAEVRSFGDWGMGCDNGRRCRAVNYNDDFERAFSIEIAREPAANAPVILVLIPEYDATTRPAEYAHAPLQLVTDRGDILFGNIAAPVAGHEIRWRLNQRQVEALRRGASLHLRNARGRDVASMSLSGISATMLAMDEAQVRLDTVTALVRTGRHPASAVPPPPALPVIRRAPASTAPALQPSPAQRATMAAASGCTITAETAAEWHEAAVRLDARHSLFLLYCNIYAYNSDAVAYIGQRVAGRAQWTLAQFDDVTASDHDSGTPNGARLLPFADWSAESRSMGGFSKGRGIGDCGISYEYAWDGARFRLTYYGEMRECRGVLGRIVTWVANIE